MESVSQYASLHLTVERTLPSVVNANQILVELGLNDQPQEVLWVIAYDSVQRIRTIVEVARGGYHNMVVPIPAVLSAVLVAGCDRFMVAHNHPTDAIEPTVIDLDLTEKIMAAANTCGMYFEDHLIIGPSGRLYSFAESGFLTPARELGEMARTHRRLKNTA